MKQESPTTLDIGIQQHKQFIDTPKDVTKSNKNVKDTTAASLIDKNKYNQCKEELDDMPNKELLSKISETLAEFYGGGKDYDESEEAQKERPRSCAKVSNITLTNEEEGEGEDIVNSIYPEIKIRDFAFPTDDPRHWGQKIIEEEEEEEDSEYVNRRARALYDFVAENSSELSFHEGDILLVQCRQYDGWLMANLGEETGLIPENYVKLLDDDDDDDDDEYGNWAEEGNNDE
ncbi:NAP1-binding protein 2 [Rhizophagus irregularis DAOM 181602=DAOM 197198]|nr:NAP1-binding protein 2 [Rhizophagus irregularis DAOM 181602=DAOM 197198]